MQIVEPAEEMERALATLGFETFRRGQREAIEQVL